MSSQYVVIPKNLRFTTVGAGHRPVRSTAFQLAEAFGEFVQCVDFGSIEAPKSTGTVNARSLRKR